MSIFKKLFGSSKSERVHVARAPRIRVTALHRILFQQMTAGNGVRPVSLGNVSTQGMGLLRAQGDLLRLGEMLRGELVVNEMSFPIESEVKHLSDSVVGCRFLSPQEVLTRAIEEYFRVEICALRLNRVDESYLKKEPEGQVFWFTDGLQNEVYFVLDQNGILRFHISFLGNYIEGGRARPLRCGHIVEDAKPDSKHKGSNLLDLTDDVTDDVLKLCCLLIDNLEKLPADQAHALKSHLQAR